MIEISNLIPFFLLFSLIGVCGLFDMPYDRSHMIVCEIPECLSLNFDSCTPAYGNIVDDDYNLYFEVRGLKDNGKCEIYLRLEDMNLDEVPEDYRSAASLAIGRSMVCETEGYEKQRVLMGDFDKEMLSKCNGVLANILEGVI
jgi:hypothetical protein